MVWPCSVSKAGKNTKVYLYIRPAYSQMWNTAIHSITWVSPLHGCLCRKAHRSTEISGGRSGDVDMSYLKEWAMFSSSFIVSSLKCLQVCAVPSRVTTIKNLERMLRVVSDLFLLDASLLKSFNTAHACRKDIPLIWCSLCIEDEWAIVNHFCLRMCIIRFKILYAA